MRSTLSKDIKRCMTNFKEMGLDHASAEFVFDNNFLGFQGHFENKPILPGVCKILAALEVLKEWKRREFVLTEIIFAKFFHPVTCNEGLLFECSEASKIPEGLLLKVKITRSDNKIAELKLKVQLCNS